MAIISTGKLFQNLQHIYLMHLLQIEYVQNTYEIMFTVNF